MNRKAAKISRTTLFSIFSFRFDQKPRLPLVCSSIIKASILTIVLFTLAAAPSFADANSSTIVLESENHRLTFNSKTGQLISLRASQAIDQEFIFPHGDDPVFVVQYLDDKRFFHQVTSKQAARIEVKSSSEPEHLLLFQFHTLGGLDLNASVTIRVVPGDPSSHWSISIDNKAGLLITDVQFPFIVLPYHLAGKPGTEALLRPYTSGQLFRAPNPQDLEPDSPHAWQFRPENGDTSHYPGLTFAQFLAYYNDRAGIYVSCQDHSGGIKLIKPVHHRTGGLRLGISHVGDWPRKGERQLPYDVVVRTFAGDWYDAADLYRQWSLTQPWAQKPLYRRMDVPSWLLDSSPHIIVRIQGQLDVGPVEPNPEFLPYPKIIPLLEKISNRINSGVTPVVMSWERPGPWIYPDCFPPAGGDQSLKEFTELARNHGWHVGSFCNGTRWVTHHYWSGYNGEQYFLEHDGEKSVCRTHDQKLWEENWAQTWRPSYAGCLSVQKTQEIAVRFVERLIDDGLDWIQFLDQNVGCSTFPCFARDHGHADSPGGWMTSSMQQLLDSFKKMGQETERQSAGKRRIVFSVETPPNEYFMPNFQVCDVRVIPPGHSGYEKRFIPLYHFLYHEFVLMQGGFGYAPEPYHMPIRTSYNLVVGEIPGGVITGDGRLLNRDTNNWAPWEPQVGDNEDSLETLRRAISLRRGKGKDYLVYGRMQSPASISMIKTIQWQWEGIDNHVPAVFHSAWRDPQGKFAVVLANWTKEQQPISIADQRLGEKVLLSESLDQMKSETRQVNGGMLDMILPPLSCVLVETQ